MPRRTKRINGGSDVPVPGAHRRRRTGGHLALVAAALLALTVVPANAALVRYVVLIDIDDVASADTFLGFDVASQVAITLTYDKDAPPTTSALPDYIWNDNLGSLSEFSIDINGTDPGGVISTPLGDLDIAIFTNGTNYAQIVFGNEIVNGQPVASSAPMLVDGNPAGSNGILQIFMTSFIFLPSDSLDFTLSLANWDNLLGVEGLFMTSSGDDVSGSISAIIQGVPPEEDDGGGDPNGQGQGGGGEAPAPAALPAGLLLMAMMRGARRRR